jgi:hypothetical protein
MTDRIGVVTGAIKTIFTGKTLTIGSDVFRLIPFDPPPPKLDTGDLPAVYTLTGPATFDHSTAGGDNRRETRLYRVQFALLTQAEATPQLRETRCRPWLDLARALLDSYPTLNRLAFVESARAVRDTGIIILPEYGGAYLGFEIQVNVTMILPVTYASSE